MAIFFNFFGNLLRNSRLLGAYPHICPEKAAAAPAAQNAVENRRAVCYDEDKSEKGVKDHV